MNRPRMPDPVEFALEEYRRIRKQFGMCALWTCPRVAEPKKNMCKKHQGYYANRQQWAPKTTPKRSVDR